MKPTAGSSRKKDSSSSSEESDSEDEQAAKTPTSEFKHSVSSVTCHSSSVYLITKFCALEPNAVKPKAAVPAKGAAQKQQESSSEDSSSDSEDEAPAKVTSGCTWCLDL